MIAKKRKPEFNPHLIVETEALLLSHIKKHPEFQLAGVCSCGKVMPAASLPGHIGGTNKAWYRKAHPKLKHHVAGYTLMATQHEECKVCGFEFSYPYLFPDDGLCLKCRDGEGASA